MNWPAKLWLIRHGESAGSMARDAAYASSREDIELEDIELKVRDVDVPGYPSPA